jgi:hypothetical protein
MPASSDASLLSRAKQTPPNSIDHVARRLGIYSLALPSLLPPVESLPHHIQSNWKNKLLGGNEEAGWLAIANPSRGECEGATSVMKAAGSRTVQQRSAL